MNKPIVSENFILGGVADNDLLGKQNSLSRIVGVDIFTDPGYATASPALQALGTINEPCYIASLPNYLYSYFFSKTSGKIWALNWQTMTVTLAYTTSPTSGSAGCCGVCYYRDNLYWATQDYLHKITIGGAFAATWTTGITANYQVFTNKDPTHPMCALNDKLYVGDGVYVAELNLTTWTPTKLTIMPTQRCNTLAAYGIYLAIGTTPFMSASYASVVVWDTFSPTFLFSDDIQENVVQALIEQDNVLYAFGEMSGIVYALNGQRMDPAERLPGANTIHPYINVPSQYAVKIFNNIMYLGIGDWTSSVTGTPGGLSGIWTRGRYAPGYPRVYAQQFPVLSAANLTTADITVNSIDVFDAGGYILIVTSYTNRTANTHGAMYTKLGASPTNCYNGAFMETRRILADARMPTTFSDAFADYASMPANCAVTLNYRKNNSAYLGSEITGQDDTDQNRVMFDLANEQFISLKLRLTFTTNGTNSPKIYRFGAIPTDQNG